jgi:hypothetical protein
MSFKKALDAKFKFELLNNGVKNIFRCLCSDVGWFNCKQEMQFFDIYDG